VKADEIHATRVFEELVAQIQKGECILFLGAGVHAPPADTSKYVYSEEHRPLLAHGLTEKLADVCQCKKFCPKMPCSDLERISLCLETTPELGRKRLVDCLAEHLDTGKKPSPILKMLVQLPFRIIVTTNYDGLLEAAFQQSDKHPTILVYDPHHGIPTPDVDQDPTEEKPVLFKMHGDLGKRDSIVITDEDYITFVQRMSDKDEVHPVPQTVRYRMKRWPTLFVGYSLLDYNLRLIFRTLRWHVDPSNFPTSFAVDVHPDPLLLRVYQHERHFISFVTQDIWTFVPQLFTKVMGHEYHEQGDPN